MKQAIASALQDIHKRYNLSFSETMSMKHYLDCIYDLGVVEGRKNKSPKMLNRSRPVGVYRNGKRECKFRSVKEAASHFGVSSSYIGNTIRRGRVRADGVSLRYVQKKGPSTPPF